MDEINGSVNVSEILATLTEGQTDLLRKQALRIIRGNSKVDLAAYTAFVYMYRDELTPVQKSAVKALLEEVRKRRDALLGQLMRAVDDAIFIGTDFFCQKIGETRKEGSDA